MSESYTNFMVFELHDNGEHQRIDIAEEDFRNAHGNGILHPSQVIIIVKEDLRSIFIWKGVESSVRKKFIASRVASELQQELMKQAGFHRCKVISVDEGEEPEDFLNAFGFKSQNVQKSIESKKNEPDKPEINVKMKQQITDQSIVSNIQVANPKPFTPKSFKQLKSEKQSRDILEKTLRNDVPSDYKRKNVLIGNNLLYGEIIKKANILGEVIEEKEWEPINNFPKEVFELESHKLRIYYNNELGKIEAIEVLELKSQEKNIDKELNYSNWTVKQLKEFCKEHNISVPSSYRKADIIRLVKDFVKSKK
ncbi:MAG: hypothetical protein ACFFGP_04955 [Promethearchaeota archaeon]